MKIFLGAFALIATVLVTPPAQGACGNAARVSAGVHRGVLLLAFPPLVMCAMVCDHEFYH